jgi:hypothetical protein
LFVINSAASLAWQPPSSIEVTHGQQGTPAATVLCCCELGREQAGAWESAEGSDVLKAVMLDWFITRQAWGNLKRTRLQPPPPLQATLLDLLRAFEVSAPITVVACCG